MDDTILIARIDALERSLEAQDTPFVWPGKFKDLHLDENTWNPLAMEIDEARSEQTERLARIRDELRAAADDDALAALWREYADVYAKSQSILRESFEILGGFAFRDRLLDEKLCSIAEDLLTTYTRYASRTPCLAVPARESVSRTMARVVRVRCPEWTIWTLPLSAHEYGKLVVNDFKDLASFVSEQREAVARRNRDGELPEDPAERAQALEDAELHLHVLIADAFGAYTLGPAYAFAALEIVLQPGAARRPDHRLRGELILAMLRAMAEEGEASFSAQIEKLDADWAAVLKRVGRDRPEPTAEVREVVELVRTERSLARVRYSDQQTAPWPRRGAHGWKTAIAWSAAWRKQLRQRQPELTVPDVESGSQIRDVLNAAWLARVERPDPEDIAKLELVACLTAEAVIEAHQTPPARGGSGEQSHGPAPR